MTSSLRLKLDNDAPTGVEDHFAPAAELCVDHADGHARALALFHQRLVLLAGHAELVENCKDNGIKVVVSTVAHFSFA